MSGDAARGGSRQRHGPRRAGNAPIGHIDSAAESRPQPSRWLELAHDCDTLAEPALAEASSSPDGGSGTCPRKCFGSAYPTIRYQRPTGVN